MGRFFVALLVLAGLVVAIVIVAPGLVPVAAYKGRIEQAASNAIGRPVTIGDDISFKLVPQTAFRVTDLQIANAEGFEGPFLARVAIADIGVKLMPLLNGQVEVDRFILTEPDINLQRAADGRVNWNLASGGAPAEDGAPSQVTDVKLGDVRIIDGKATYADAGAGRTYTAEDMDLAVTLTSLSEPLEVEGTMTFEGAPSRLNLVLTSLAKVMASEPASLKLDLAAGSAEAAADLVVETTPALAWTGPVRLNAPDLPAFAKILGTPIAEGPGFDALKIEGNAAGAADGLRLSSADIAFDKIDATGDVRLDWSGERPQLTGRIDAGSLDLRPYLPPPAPDAQGFPAWSEEKLDFSGLRNIDADLDLSADKIFLNELEFGESRMGLKIDAGRMVADFSELGIYGGGGAGEFVVNARQALPTFAGKFDVTSVQAQPFALDLMKTDRLLGLGGFKLDFTASGSSQAAIMRSMNGAGGFDVADGALKGVNIAKLARTLDQIRQGGLNPAAIANAVAEAQKPDEKTDFNSLLSQFQISSGVVSAPTIALQGPYLLMTGTGTVNLPNQTLDLRLAPRATTTIDGEGGRAVAIPMRVTGTFSEPKIVIDVEALLRGRLEQGLKGIIGGAAGSESGTPAATPEEAARKALEGILGGPRPAPAEPAAPGEPQTQTTPKSPVEGALDILLGGARKPAPAPAEPAPAPAEAEPASEPEPVDPQ